MHKRNCPACTTEISYSSKGTYTKAIKRNSKCKKCKDSNKRISNDKIKEILLLNDNNIPNIEISKLTKVSYNAVRAILDKNSRKSVLISHTINMVSDDEAQCTKCGEISSIKHFSVTGKNPLWRTSICNKCCQNRRYNQLNSTIEKYLSYRFARMNRTSIVRGINVSISKEDFMNQFHIQNGKCFYTGVDLICKVGREKERGVLSIDRVDTTKGYVKGNVVFCTYRINSVKNDLTLEEIKEWMPGFFQKIADFLGEQNAASTELSN